MYDYRKELKEEIKKYVTSKIINNQVLTENLSRGEIEAIVSSGLMDSDSTNDACRNYVEDNIDLFKEVCFNFKISYSTIGYWFLNQDFKTINNLIRSYLLKKCINEVLDELIKEDYF